MRMCRSLSCVMVPLLADQPELSKYGEYKNEDDDKYKDKDDDKDKDDKSSISLKVMFFIKMKYMDYRQGLTKTLKKRNNFDQQGLGRIRQVLDNFYHHHNSTASS